MRSQHIKCFEDVFFLYNIEMKNKKYQTVGTSPNFNHTSEKRGKFATLNTEMNDRSLSLLVTATSIKCGGVKLFVWV